MSKIITKRQLGFVIESTLKEVSPVNENENEIKLTKDHMDKLHNEGHCMCGDKCLVYPEAVSDSKKSLEVVKLVAEKGGDCVVMEKQHMDMLEKDGKCDCNGITLTYDENMVEGDHMEDGMNENKEMCSECGTGMMVEGVCNGCGYSTNISEEDTETDVEEGNEFTGELSKAKEAGENTFTVDGKTYKVESADSVEESVNDITESIKNTVNKNLINEEEMNFFNKMVNYKK